MTDGPQQPNQPGEQQPPSGYGYPQQQPGYGYPQQQPQQPSSGYGSPQQQSGYGYPQQPQEEEHSGTAWTPPSGHIGEGGSSQGAEPDWSALAERTEAGSRRRKLLMVGGGILAVVVLAGIVTTAVVVSGHHGKTVARPTATATTDDQPTPTFSDVTPTPAPDPLAVLSDSRRDTAPLTTAALFPRLKLDFPGRTYTKEITDSTTSCAAVADGRLGGVLSEYGCRRMLRATYRRGGVSVTVGIAQFPTKADADGAKTNAEPYLAPLSGGGSGSFCQHRASCQATVNAIGRYAYFTIAGKVGDISVLNTDPQTAQCAKDVADFAFASIVQRGRQEAGSGTS